MMSYALRDLLRYQTNMDKHDPDECLKDVELWNKDSNSTKPCNTVKPMFTAPGAMVGRNG